MMPPLSPHLQVMGIQQWVRRALPAEPPTEDSAEDGLGEVIDGSVHSEQTPAVGTDGGLSTRIETVGESSAPLWLVTTPLEPTAEPLLDAMLQAIGVKRGGCYQITLLEDSLYSDVTFHTYLQQQLEQAQPQALLQLGGAPLPSPLGFEVQHPNHLLSHPEEKRGVWDTLKRLHIQLNGQ